MMTDDDDDYDKDDEDFEDVDNDVVDVVDVVGDNQEGDGPRYQDLPSNFQYGDEREGAERNTDSAGDILLL
jgi:hypothetical protein